MAKLVANRGNHHEFRDEMGRGSTEDTANFAASFVKGHLKGIHEAQLVIICEPGFGSVSKNGEDNGSDNSLP